MQSKILVPEMVKLGYDKSFSAAVTATSSVITPIIPPGIILIMYATASNTSVQKMFFGGVIPGVLLTLGLMLVAAIISHKRNYRGSRTQLASLREIGSNLKESIFALLVPFGLIMGLRFGMFTATEGGAICAVYALIVGIFIYREIRLKDFFPILQETIESTAAIMFLLASAQALGRYLTWESLPQRISEALTATFTTPFVFLMAVNVLLLVVGCFFDGGAAMVLCAPLLAPAAAALGIDLIHFGIIMSINLTIGGVTPPFGTLMFVTCQITETKMEHFVKSVIPFLLIEIGILFLCTYVPQVVTCLPNLLS
ncbi:TRAP transporter large permease [Anaerotruncus rubiinfantis]